MSPLPTFADVQAAHDRLREGILRSPCTNSVPLSETTGARIACKRDYLQRTGSFKERGARNALLLLSPEQRCRGVVAASAGNHALGLAYHGMLLNIPVTVVMPRYAPLIKIETCRELRARVILHGKDFDEAQIHAAELVQREGLSYIHPFNDPAIIAGQGSMGIEIIEQIPDVEVIVAPIGGGGLIAGLALAIKHLKPDCKLIGVEPLYAACFTGALKAGRPVPVAVRPTLADGLAVKEAGDLTFATAKSLLDRVVTVSEAELALAILRLVEMEKSVAEGAGAAPLAACLSGKIDDLIKDKRVVLTLCGGNIDPNILSRVIEKGLVADGRLYRFTAIISDRPGGLAALSEMISSTGANIRDILHDRAFAGPDISAVNVFCVVEVRNREHVTQLHQVLEAGGIEVIDERLHSKIDRHRTAEKLLEAAPGKAALFH